MSALTSRMKASTPASTEGTFVVILSCLTTLALGAVAWRQHEAVGPAAVAAAVACLTVAALFGPLGGLGTGVVAAAAYVGLASRSATWDHTRFPDAMVTCALLVVAGWNVGLVRQVLSSSRGAGPDRAGSMPYPALGGFPLPQGMLRLQEEVERARSTGAPLGLLMVETSPTRASLTQDGVESARRGVTRVVLSRSRSTDVPIEVAEGLLALVIPLADRPSTWELLTSVVQGYREAAFTDRTREALLPLREYLRMECAVTYLDDTHTSAEEYLRAARRAVRPDLEESA